MKIKTYRKKPVLVQAMKYDGSIESAADIQQWCGGQAVKVGPNLEIKTLEGTFRANPGDFIIQGIAGEFYPCKPQIFRETYDRHVGIIK
jgi:hypothetical protein